MSNKEAPAPASNFLRNIIERDLEQGTYAQRRWAGQPGGAVVQTKGEPDPAKIRTRFPPEPNGYLHIGHVKSICLNHGLARDYNGAFHLRFDDTNPEKEEQEYVDSIVESMRWLGADWTSPFAQGEQHLYYASNYFDFMYAAAEYLIEAGHAYVDEQSAEEMRANRGDFTTPGTNSPWRSRTVAENLQRFREMRAGQHADGSMVLRAKIDMASPNINLRDPALYRIKRATHHNTGDAWCIYPMYTYAHPIEDALENITHSICTLEFEDQRPFYDWLLERLAEGGLLTKPLPHQYEFARLNLTYIVTSKRKLKQLVDEKHVDGWDDPRMPTLVGLRRRGYTPEALRLFCDRTGASKANSWIDYSVLEATLREDLEGRAARAMAVVKPLKLVITNFEGEPVACSAPAHPQKPELGTRHFQFSRELWIEAEDFMEAPEKGYHRLYPPRVDEAGVTVPGNKVRLKYGFVVECTGFKKDEAGHITEVHATYFPDSKSGTPGADNYKVKGVITWVSATDAVAAEVRLYDRFFTEPHPDAGGRDFLSVVNPKSKQVVTAWLEPSLANAKPDDKFQFERIGYFVADRKDHTAEKPVFNMAVGLKDSWGK
ncbi:glutamine--tRNA ligase/YqeY domain fusion protein [Piscinibacterium candidicorallinum]|uniref:Glutamine--tRNA ligase n=1 Tax=Piscinibacterium candidicorallinum TaxID=1793872 RepID=A0ABV7H6B5_9BURK